MTGQGQSRRQFGALTVHAEVRAVNNRFLKVTVSCSDRYPELEAKVKTMVQSRVRRGSLHIHLEIQRQDQLSPYRINGEVLRSYHEQLTALEIDVPISDCLELPGVVQESHDHDNSDDHWSDIETAIGEALDELIDMRRREGASMAADLASNCEQIHEQLTGIQHRAPDVVQEYTRRLTDRINQLLSEFQVSVSASDVVREVGIFADRCDISEEIVRLQAHLSQFSESLKSSQSDGRKLEFLTQEMLRETNTIGSKANDSEIAQRVVEIKTAIERIREMTQNIE